MKKKYNFREKMKSTIKCVLVGDSGVGKSSLANRLSSRDFKEEYTPTVFDNYAATVMLDQKSFHFSLFDTAGKDDYDRLRVISYMNCDVFLICYSVADKESLKSVEEHWVPELKHYLPKAPFILVGTRIDLRNTDSNTTVEPKSFVSFKEAAELADKTGASSYVECSALTKEGITDVIRETIEAVLKTGDYRVEPKSFVSFKEAAELADKTGASSYVECSALTKEGITDVIRETVEAVLKTGDCRVNKGTCCQCNAL